MLLPSKSSRKPAFSSSGLSVFGALAATAGLSSAKAAGTNDTNAGATRRAARAAVRILGERVMGVSLSAVGKGDYRAAAVVRSPELLPRAGGKVADWRERLPIPSPRTPGEGGHRFRNLNAIPPP